jgi:uncharacterized protein
MEAPVLLGVKNLLARRAAGLDDLRISWFGGEPLLALDIIEEMHTYVHTLRGAHPGMRFSADMTTNAYLLTRETFESLLGLGVTSYQIPFDGPRACHDQKRVLPGGGGTFDRIWRHVTALREVPEPFDVTLRIHVDEDNLGAIPGFIEECGDAFGGDPRFRLFIRPLSRLGGANDENLCTLEEDMADEKIRALQNLANARGLGQLYMDDPCMPCYAAWGNSFIIRADGRINKCSIIMEHPVNQVGRLNEDGTLYFNKPRFMAWMRGLLSEASEEIRCPLNSFQGTSAS